MAEKIILAQLDLDVQGLIKSSADCRQAIAQLKAELQALKDAGEASSSQFRQTQETLQKLLTALDAQTKALTAHVNKNKELADSQKTLVKTAQASAGAFEELSRAMDGSATAMDSLEGTADGIAGSLAGANAAIRENNALLAESSTSAQQQVTTFNDYKEQVRESLDNINLFNGGLGGFISRAQEAGGTGPLVAKAFSRMAEGIGGMTKSAMAFIATPLGAIIAALAAVLSPVIKFLTGTEEGMDRITAVTRPLQSVFHALMTVFQNVGKFLVDAFTKPQESMTALYEFVKQNLINRFTAFGEILEGIMTLDFKKIGNGVLQAATGVEDVIGKAQNAAKATGDFFDEAWKRGQKIDTLQKQLDKSQADYTKRTAELGRELDAQNTIADDTNKSFGEREAAALKAIETAKAQNKLMKERLGQEAELLKLKLEQDGLTSKEKAEIEELVQKQKEAIAQGIEMEKAGQEKVATIRKEQRDKEEAARQKALDDALTKQKQELDLFIAQGNEKAKTLKERLKLEEYIAQKSLDLLKAELNAKKITELQYQKAQLDIKAALSQKIVDINVEQSRALLELELQNSKSVLEGQEKLTQELLDEEQVRLKTIMNKKLDLLAEEKGLIRESIDNSTSALKTLTSAELEYLQAKAQLNEEFERQKLENDKAFLAGQDQEKAEKKLIDVALAQTEYDEKLVLEQQRHEAELERLNEWKEQGLITEAQYQEHLQSLEEETAKNKQRLALQNAQTQLGTLQNVANALGEAFGQSKEMAIAQATMNAGQAILSIWAGSITGNPLTDSIIKGVLTATTAVKTAKQIKEIKSAKKPKPPKFEQGGLMSVGGNRHSAGGTLFSGSDGTAFEAEQGELIGVMNRNAARHFMAFNNAFPSGGTTAPNYFANGGIVSREMAQQQINMDELAAKIAQANASLPPPVVAVQDIITEGNSYVRVREGANF